MTNARDRALAPPTATPPIGATRGALTPTAPPPPAALAIRYVPWTSDIDQALFSPRPLWLVRGQYRTGRNDFDICHGRA